MLALETEVGKLPDAAMIIVVPPGDSRVITNVLKLPLLTLSPKSIFTCLKTFAGELNGLTKPETVIVFMSGPFHVLYALPELLVNVCAREIAPPVNAAIIKTQESIRKQFADFIIIRTKLFFKPKNTFLKFTYSHGVRKAIGSIKAYFNPAQM